MSDSSFQPPGAQEDPVARACALLTSWTGLALRGMAPRRVDEFLRRRAARLGYPSPAEYVDFLHSQPATGEEAQRLTNLVTNGLTCFWRDTPQLDALAQVLRALRDAQDAAPTSARALNIWCAGCSTGEETYTVAMLAADLGVAVRVLGSDINTDSLQHARRGVYGEWSLRRVSPELRARHFEPLQAAHWTVRAGVRAHVDFLHHNILTSAPRPPGAEHWDVILCRNVLIYFSAQTVQDVLGLFAQRLAPCGYLVLGSSEHLQVTGSAGSDVRFHLARQGMGFVYQTDGSARTQTPASSSEDDIPAGLDADPSSPTLDLNFPVFPPVSAPDTAPDSSGHLAADSLLRAAVEHLENQQLEAALACCEASASYDPFVPENYCLMGYMLQRAGAPSQALATYRKALFLDPFLWVAALESARIHIELDDPRRARRLLRQALEGLQPGRALSTGMARLLAAMTHTITSAPEAARFCQQQLDALRAG